MNDNFTQPPQALTTSVETLWRKSTKSPNTNGQCLQSRLSQSGQQLRDSKLGETSPVFTLARDDFSALLTHLK